jgi:multidrug resistance efflux pump
MAFVPLDDIWITANFKETQLQRIRPGQRVKFSVDADDHEYAGRVTGIGGASGSRFSALPPENATGNYVKVVQRIPVRIDLDRRREQGPPPAPRHVGDSPRVRDPVREHCFEWLKSKPRRVLRRLAKKSGSPAPIPG